MLAFAALSAASLSFSACRTYTPPPVPDHVRDARVILGDEADIQAGIRLSSFYRSFLSELETHAGLDDARAATLAERSRSFLEHFGLDPDGHDVTAMLALARADERSIPAFLLHAPVSEEALERAAANWQPFKRVEKDSAGASAGLGDIYSLSGGNRELFVARASADWMIATPSRRRVESMIRRIESVGNEPVQSPDGEESLFERVAGADAWFLLADARFVAGEIPEAQLSAEMTRLVRAIDGSAASLMLEQDAAVIDIFLRPREDVAADDLSDLIRGALAVAKLQAKNRPEILDVLEGIDVSESSGLSRVQFRITEENLENLIRNVDYR